jgi:hypothetical protein
VPFCASKCHFCFKTQTNPKTQLLDSSLHERYAEPSNELDAGIVWNDWDSDEGDQDSGLMVISVPGSM